MPPRTTPSTRSSCCEESFLPSGRPGTGMRHTASDGVSGAGRLAHVHIADTGNPPASDTRPDTPGRPPPSRTDAETRAGLQERAAGAPAYAISGGLLKQPDKHEWANAVLLLRRQLSGPLSGFSRTTSRLDLKKLHNDRYLVYPSAKTHNWHRR